MRIHHFGVQVRDLERAVTFYTQVLGLQLTEIVEMGGQSYYFVGDDRMMLEIEQAYEPFTQSGSCGFGHLALAVEDLEAYCVTLRQHKVEFILEPSQFRPDRKIAFISDPEGNRIQLIQFI